MILLADSGSTKTDWCLAEGGGIILQVKTKGINPFYQTTEEISKEIKTGLVPYLKDYRIDEVYFYGAGCAFPEKNEMVGDALAGYLNAPIAIGSDLLAAAHALCGYEAGIACIMGTGSNSCFYDGKAICDNVSPLGFILGDEGSGAVLGKLLVSDCLKNQLPSDIQTEFFDQFGLTRADILDKVYKQPFPNRFLSGLSPFLLQNIQRPEIRKLVSDSFLSFFKRNVMQYDYRDYPVHIVGSIAYFYRDIIKETAAEIGVTIGQIVQSPMKGLIDYHFQKN